MNGDGKIITVINSDYTKHQIEHIRNLITMVEGNINVKEGGSAKVIKKNVDNSIDALREEVDNLKYRYSFYYSEDE